MTIIQYYHLDIHLSLPPATDELLKMVRCSCHKHNIIPVKCSACGNCRGSGCTNSNKPIHDESVSIGISFPSFFYPHSLGHHYLSTPIVGSKLEGCGILQQVGGTCLQEVFIGTIYNNVYSAEGLVVPQVSQLYVLKCLFSCSADLLWDS